MLEFNEKNYLKRTEYISSIDSNRIWSKSMTVPEMKLMLDCLEKELLEHDFDVDENFVESSRRKTLKGMIEKREQEKVGNLYEKEKIAESLFNFWEFVGDEYFGDYISVSRDLGIPREKLMEMDSEYRKKGIICSQEKDVILEMIQLLKNELNNVNNNNESIKEILMKQYETPEKWAEDTIRAHSHHGPISEEDLKRLKSCKTWDDVLILEKEVVSHLLR